MLTVLLAFSLMTATTEKAYDATLISCYDGDTCTFDFRITAYAGLGVTLAATFSGQKIRACDIDAPEMSGGTVETKAAAVKARDQLLAWLKAAKVIKVGIVQKATCEPTACDLTDKYGRWLAYIYADGEELNAKLIASGLVKDYTPKCR